MQPGDDESRASCTWHCVVKPWAWEDAQQKGSEGSFTHLVLRQTSTTGQENCSGFYTKPQEPQQSLSL